MTDERIPYKVSGTPTHFLDGETITTPDGDASLQHLIDVHARNRFGIDHLTRAQRISASGNNTILTPASGKLIRLHWLGLSSPEANSAEVLAIVKFGSIEHYRWNLGMPGAFSHWQVIEGEVDQSLVIDLSAAQNAVDVSYTYEEI